MQSAGDERRVGVSVLGSTGSVGCQALDVLDAHRDRFQVVALAARSRSERLLGQVARFSPELVSITDDNQGSFEVPGAVVSGANALVAAATHPAAEIVIVATSGHAAIVPTMRAIEAGKIIALANKEALVCAGELLIPLARKHGMSIRPVDSEHSAIWQALVGTPIDAVKRIVVTASGGPFRTLSIEAFPDISVQAALAHPTWAMGGKITVDSATLMNKGLEVIEAHWLFDLPYDQIEVVIHPESIVHSLVEFVDGSILAQLGLPDMKLPIQYALTYPDRAALAGKRLDLAAIGALHFESPDETRFPALRLARQAGLSGQTYPTALSAADDEAVAAFLGGALRFVDITAVVEKVLMSHQPAEVTLESIDWTDTWARREAREVITELNGT